MRCESCNAVLSPYEDSIVGAKSNKRLGLCRRCLKGMDIEYYGEPTALHSVDEYDDGADDETQG